MSQQAATIMSLPQAFEVVKEMQAGGDVRIYVSGGKGVLPVVTTTTNRSTPHVPASCDDHEPTPGL